MSSKAVASKQQTTSQKIVFIAAVVILWVALIFATYVGWIHGTDHRDFYPWWAGARLVLSERVDVYSPETIRRMQIMLYGAERPPGLDPQAFHFPAILIPLMLPFWFIPNVEIGAAVWEATSVILLLGALLLIRRRWKAPPLWAIILFLLWYYTILMLFQAQIHALPLSALAVGVWAYAERRDLLAGAVIVAAGVKPEQAAIPVLLFLLVALRDRRWQVLKAFAIAAALLFGASVLIAGWWVPGWIAIIGRYGTYAASSWSPRVAWEIHPLILVALAAAVVVCLIRTRWNTRSAISVGLPLALLALPQTLIWGLTILLLSLALSWRGSARYGVMAVWLIGWLLILGTGIDGWWRVQALLIPLLTLIVAAEASRIPARDDSETGYNTK